jgi:DNA-binding CsgD family transcriptional regulator/tetratricopeptide (TPR) repeat protein
VIGLSGFVGRDRELSALHSALTGDTRLVLVAGDAGVGKTRFVTEGLRAAGPALRAWGACLPLTEKLPLLPVAEALDALSRLDGGKLFEQALAGAPPYARAEAARLLPQLQPAGASEASRPGGGQREHMFSGLTELLAAAARRGGLVLVIEDVHWADSATLDFLTFLARSGRSGAVTVVATCRSDEAPLEPHLIRWLAHLRGNGQAAEIRLAPLSRAELAEQITCLMPDPPPAGLADELYARSEGNPFYTEQLVADALAGQLGGGLGQLPDRLAELLAARTSGCSPAARAVLAALAVAGRPLAEDQLREVAGLHAEALHDAVRELADARLLGEATPGGRYRTRHALLAESVAAGLLPGERLILHERMARVLEAPGEEALAAEAADHWAAIGRDAEELRARLTAAAAAGRVFGFAEAAAHWQRAIELCQAGRGAPGQAERELPGLFVRAIDARHLSGDVQGAGELAEEAFRLFAGHRDPAVAAVVHERAARFRGIGDVFLGGQGEPGSGLPLIAEALRLFGQAPPSDEHAEALFYYGHYLFWGAEREHGLSILDQALKIAEAAGASALVPRILPTLAYREFLAGRMDAGFEVLRRSRALAEAAWDGESGLMIDVYESDALLKTAEFGDAAEVALRGLSTVREAGLEDFWTTAILAANLAEALLHQGRTAQAAEFIGPLTDGPPDRDYWFAHVFRSEVDLLRGDLAAAAQRQAQIAELIGRVSNVEWSRESALRVAELQLWAGHPGRALAAVRAALAQLPSPDWAMFCGRLLSTGMRAAADLAERARARQDDAAFQAAVAAGDDLASSAAGLGADPFADHPFTAASTAERVTWAAEHRRLAGPADPAAWAAAADAWAWLNWPHRAGYARWRQAQAHLHAGQAREAAGALRAAAALATEHAPLLAEIRKLALRARISLPLAVPPGSAAPQPSSSRPAPGYGLTSRELSVLRLLAAGRTNAEIGADLFISPKTASVHVTNILRKLGVSGRVQAATAAERAGLLDGEQA